MESFFCASVLLVFALGVAGCGSALPPKYENGQYVPPPAIHALKIDVQNGACDGGSAALPAALAPLIISAGTAAASYSYDRYVNWLEEKQANLSVSSSGVASTSFLSNGEPRRCVVLSRADSLRASFSISRVGDSGYWHMTPYSMNFARSEAREKPEDIKSIVAEIELATPDASGKPVAFFAATFDLGRHKAGSADYSAADFVGQDSGPYSVPKASDPKDSSLTIKVAASLIEHGESRDWVRGAAVFLREQENKDKVLKPIKDALGKLAP